MAAFDWVILAFFLAVSAGIGIVGGLLVKGTDDYFMGGRRFGKWLMIGQSFTVGTHPEMIVSLSGAVYLNGVSAIWYQWKNLFATPFYWVMAPVFRRVRRTTMSEVTEDRYGSWMAAIYTLFALSFFLINMASILKGAAKVIYQAVGQDVSVNETILAMAAVFILYSLFGGLLATAWNQFFQGFLIVTLSFMLIPLAWPLVGGWQGLHQALPRSSFSIVTPEGIGPWIILMLTLNGLIGIMAMPHVLASVGTGRKELACREGFLYGTFIKRFCTIGWTMVGLLVAGLAARGAFGSGHLLDPEDAFGFAARQLLFPGLLGLLVACILAASMGACSAYMVDGGALFTQSFYRRFLVRSAPDRHYLWIGRASGFVVTLLAVLYSLFLIDRVLYSFLLTETMATYIGVSIVGGLIWKRANRWGALASLVAAFSTNFLLYYFQDRRLDAWDPNVFLASLLAGSAALVLFSWLSPRESEVALRDFFARLESSSDENGGMTTQGNREPLLLISLLELRKAARPRGVFRAFRTDWVGLLRGFLMVLALVGLAWLIFAAPR